MINHNNWYLHFFDGLALNLWKRAITPEYTEREIEFLQKIVTFPHNGYILDMPCGFGRHALLLAAQGFRVTGVDLAVEYISSLESEARQQNLPVTAVPLDMLEFKSSETFDIVLCLGNSFNYFSYDKMKRFITVVATALKQGGKVVVNTGSLAESVMVHGKEQNWMQLGDMLFLMAHEHDCMRGFLKTDMQFIMGGRTERKTAYHFTYTLAEIARLFQSENLEIKAVYSDFEGNLFKRGDDQAYILAEKL